MPAALLYENVGFQGYVFGVENGQNIPVIPPPMGSGDGQASSMYVYGPQWITFWEAHNYNPGDDSLWIHPPRQGYMWVLDNLHRLCRPHGTNHWGDRIRGVSFSGAPTGSNENRTVINANGSVICGNRLFSMEEFQKEFGVTIEMVSLKSELVPEGE